MELSDDQEILEDAYATPLTAPTDEHCAQFDAICKELTHIRGERKDGVDLPQLDYVLTIEKKAESGGNQKQVPMGDVNMLQWYNDHLEEVIRLYKSSIAVWLWPGDDTDVRIIPDITKLYRILDQWGEDENGEMRYEDVLVIPFMGWDSDIFWGLTILRVEDGTIIPREGISLTKNYFFCNKCEKDFVMGYLCETCDYDLCKECWTSRENLLIHYSNSQNTMEL